jgi:hypothetical protein
VNCSGSAPESLKNCDEKESYNTLYAFVVSFSWSSIDAEP